MPSLRPTPKLLRWSTLGLLISAAPIFIAQAWPIVFVAWTALAGAALVDAFLLIRARPEFSLALPAEVGVGERFAATLRLHIRGRIRWRCRFTAHTSRIIVPTEEKPFLANAGRSETEVSYRAVSRGTATFASSWLMLSGAFGLLEAIWEKSGPEHVAVTPFSEKMRREVIRHVPGLQRRGGHRLARRSGEGTEFDSLHAYVAGMDMRNVDWKASARHHALRVRRFRHERNQNIVVCVDTGRLMRRTIDTLTRLDHAIHASLLLAETAVRGRDLVSFAAYGAAPRAFLPPATTLRQLGRIRRACAGLHTETEETNHALGLHALLGRLRRRSFVVVMTDFVDSTTAEIMTEHLAEIAKRHFVVFVSFDDPEFTNALRLESDHPQAVAQAVVRARISRQRERVMGRLRHLGVRVVRGSPTESAVHLLHHYLDAKRRGQIG